MEQFAKLLLAAIKLKEQQRAITAHGYRVACGRLEAALRRLLEAQLTDPDNARLAKRLQKHRHQLFTFLYDEATVNTYTGSRMGKI